MHTIAYHIWIRSRISLTSFGNGHKLGRRYGGGLGDVTPPPLKKALSANLGCKLILSVNSKTALLKGQDCRNWGQKMVEPMHFVSGRKLKGAIPLKMSYGRTQYGRKSAKEFPFCLGLFAITGCFTRDKQRMFCQMWNCSGTMSWLLVTQIRYYHHLGTTLNCDGKNQHCLETRLDCHGEMLPLK